MVPVYFKVPSFKKTATFFCFICLQIQSSKDMRGLNDLEIIQGLFYTSTNPGEVHINLTTIIESPYTLIVMIPLAIAI